MRADSTLEKLGTLKPAFDRRSGQGTLTAGNSTPLTDGASAVLLASEEWARAAQPAGARVFQLQQAVGGRLRRRQ